MRVPVVAERKLIAQFRIVRLAEKYLRENGSVTLTSGFLSHYPKSIRQQLGIRKGSKIAFKIVNDHIELKVQSSPAKISSSSFEILKTQYPAACSTFPLLQLILWQWIKKRIGYRAL